MRLDSLIHRARTEGAFFPLFFLLFFSFFFFQIAPTCPCALHRCTRPAALLLPVSFRPGQDCVIQIKGKLASLAIDKAVKSGIVWEQCVGSAEVVNSSSIQIQGKAPSFAIDKSSGVTLFLTKDDTESSIFTSLASEVNINVLAENEDPKETNVPSQFVTTFQNGNWVTAPVEHVGV